MLSKVTAFIREHSMIAPGEHIVCALSGGADSVALFWALYLLREKLNFTLSAAHFNHGLRGQESQRDEDFARSLCEGYGVEFVCGREAVTAGEKGLEAAAREARYRFFETLSGKIATAHTADDNAETLIMHLVRGTGLKGLGGIAPVRGAYIRPMLTVTRQDVLAFLDSYHLSYMEDSSNGEDDFLRNRIRHRVMPLLKAENPSLAQNLTQTALRLRQDEVLISSLLEDTLPPVSALQTMPSALRRRYLTGFLESCGVKEPEGAHIELLEKLVFSKNPSAQAYFPGNITVTRQYDKLLLAAPQGAWETQILPCPGMLSLPDGLTVQCTPAQDTCLTWDCFTVYSQGQMVVRPRQPGDRLRLQGGSKSLKAIFVDKKIPRQEREALPVVADSKGVLGVYKIGANLDRVQGQGEPVCIRFFTKED